MPLDYSKWDNIELSDDEDFECHPNVDKKSMIRWKQAELYRVRRERNDKIQILKKELDTNQTIIDALQTLLPITSPAELATKLTIMKGVFHSKDQLFNKEEMETRFRQRDSRWREPEPFPICESRYKFDDLIQKIIDVVKDGPDCKVEKLKEGVKMIEDLLAKRKVDCENEIKMEEAEANKKLTSENMYKEVFSATAVAPTKQKVIETIHNPSSSQTLPASSNLNQTATAAEKPTSTSNSKLSASEQFATITDLEESYKFLSSHPELVNQANSDEVMAQGFTYEMEGKTKLCKNAVFQALLLQYSALLGKDGVSLFFSRMRIPNHKSRDFMMDDVNKTYNRIVARVKEIKAKELSDAEIDRAAALEYLNSHLQPDGTYALPLTEESSLEEIERAKVFAEFPVVLQKGLLLQDPDAINDGLKGLDQDTINLYLKKATDVGLISLEEEEDAEEEVEETKENQTQASDADGKMKKATPDEY